MNQPASRSALNAIPADIRCAADYARLAPAFIAPAIFAHVDGGSGHDRTAAANLSAFEKLAIVPRMLRPVRDGHIGTSLNGVVRPHPILLAPVGSQALVHPQAERAAAAAAAATHACMVASTMSSIMLEDIARTAGPDRWFQLYFQPNRAVTLDLVRRAETAGYTALMVTVDTPIQVPSHRALAAGFQPPAAAPNLAAVPDPAPIELGEGQSRILNGLMRTAPTVEDIDWLLEETSLPLWIKGILHGDDARDLMARGAAGIVVSNHGGRALDGAPSSLSRLSPVRAALGPSTTAAVRWRDPLRRRYFQGDRAGRGRRADRPAATLRARRRRRFGRGAHDPAAARGAGDLHGAGGVRHPRRHSPRRTGGARFQRRVRDMMVVIEGVLDRAALAAVRAKLVEAPWEDGGRTAGAFAQGRKNNQQLGDGSDLAVELGRLIVDRLWTNPLFISAALPRKLYPPRFNRYGIGQTYGAHVDAALMRPPGADQMLRTDLSATLYLSDPEDYDGGELEIESNVGAQAVKLAAGDLVLYLATSLHRVAPITRGERLASFFWIESLVADDGERGTLFELDQSIQRLSGQLGTDNPELVGLTGIYHNLVRRWAAT